MAEKNATIVETAPAAVAKSAPDEEIDIKDLKPQKVKELMKRDPAFISRLISQLDKQMHSMMHEKERRTQQIAEDQARIRKIDDTIAQHVQPQLDKLRSGIKAKAELRAQVEKQLDLELGRFRDLEREAAGILLRAKHKTGKLMRQAASQSLLDARGYCPTTPTTSILKPKTSAKQ